MLNTLIGDAKSKIIFATHYFKVARVLKNTFEVTDNPNDMLNQDPLIIIT